ncbi:MAG: class I SAM-dependent methyltransferase [Blastocatellia bacterium]
MNSVLSSLRTGRLKKVFSYTQNRFPSLYSRMRNKLSLLHWYWISYSNRLRGKDRFDPYGTAFWEFHDTGNWDGFAEVVLKHFSPRSVLDIGCGQGNALAGFRRVDPQLELSGVEYSRTALAIARTRSLNIHQVNIAALNRSKIDSLFASTGSIDIVLCLEVAEHMPARRSGNLLDLLTRFDTIIFSAAHLNQGGDLHVNEQPAEYWIERFEKLGFRIASNNPAFRFDVGNLDLPNWYHENINVFERAS